MTCPLTDRQIKIVSRVAAGDHRKIIASDLGVSLASICHWMQDARILARVHTDEHLVATAIRNGWIQ